MSPFLNLDSLLERALEEFYSKNGGSQAENPFFLSKEKISNELSNSLFNAFDLTGLYNLCERLKLNDFEKNILLLLFATEVDPKYGRVFAYLQNSIEKTRPTVHLIASLLSHNRDEYREILTYFRDDKSKLMLFGLIHSDDNDASITSFCDPLYLAGSVLDYILQTPSLDERVRPFCKVLEPTDAKSLDSSLINKLEILKEKREPFVLNLFGEDEESRLQTAHAVASRLNFGLCLVDVVAGIRKIENRNFTKPLLRDALLCGTLPFFIGMEDLEDNEPSTIDEIVRDLGNLSWLTIISTKRRWAGGNNHDLFVLHHKTGSLQTQIGTEWENSLSFLDEIVNVKYLALSLPKLFNFSKSEISHIGKTLELKLKAGERVDELEVMKVCSQNVRSNLDTLADRVETDLKFVDIVLPNDSIRRIEEALSHYRNQFKVFNEWGFKRHFQSMGLTLLFSGPSGTGKTMAASIVANELKLDLYRIDLSNIVSKYIGETEKQLSKIFEAAEKSGVILFFDEADAIFGKRSETKDAHDRYANIEVSYLLQRIECYDGIVILSTNLKKNIDEAFIRRMRFIIEFPMPGVSERKEIWQKMLPKESLPLNEIDFSLIANRFKLSGAGIRNAALFAAFKAAEQGKAIGMEHVLEGIKEELQKSGKTLNERDFKIGDGRG